MLRESPLKPKSGLSGPPVRLASKERTRTWGTTEAAADKSVRPTQATSAEARSACTAWATSSRRGISDAPARQTLSR
jgi:hypothetical protein